MNAVSKGPVAPVVTVSEQIWADIKDREINMFSLPEQLVSNYCEVQQVEPTKLYLKAKASSFLPALEELLKKEYTVEMHDKFIVVSSK